jgi:hypothetical protein
VRMNTPPDAVILASLCRQQRSRKQKGAGFGLPPLPLTSSYANCRSPCPMADDRKAHTCVVESNQLTMPCSPTRPPGKLASSEGGTHVRWWQRPASVASDAPTYPSTAVTSRGKSVSSSQYHAWLSRVEQLEVAVCSSFLWLWRGW